MAIDGIITRIEQLLDDEDDLECWREVVRTLVVDDLGEPLAAYRGSDAIVLEIGRCSHWLRPHQTRWSAAGGFAWPTGYGEGDGGFSRWGVPQFDWSERWARDDEGRWCPAKGQPSRRPLTLRIALPARTRRHASAAIHTLWSPGAPWSARSKIVQFHGFRREDGRWQRSATSGAWRS
ncbi:hypothetical protein ACNOYE_10905 [Nannocystaceae bacterium ST9]